MPAVTAPATPARERSCPLDMNRRLLMGFIDRLREDGHLASAPIYLPGEDYLRELAEAYLADVGPAAGAAPSECLRLHDAVLWEDRRHRPFERLLTRRFSHLLPKRAGDEGGPAPDAVLSRRAIPGLMAALSKMVGPATLEDAARRTEALLTRHREDRLGLVDWPQLTAQPEAEAVLCEVLMAAARHFQDVGRRLDWLTEVINGHLPPPLPEDHDPAWRCDAGRTRLLLRALYEPLTERLSDPAATGVLRRRFGDVAVTDAARLLAALEREA
ncbi:hypothetical protein [Caenispirillum salinarum]|uniref:hypothetical protein n=1 Tax=Caenispirillum salinarum TaxID=859058 RepID=UPI003850267C